MSRDPLDPTSDGQSSGRSNRDLIAAGLYAVLATAVLIVGSGLPPAVRVPVALPLLLFVPGYAVVAALLPARRSPSASPGSGRADGLERSPPDGYDGLSGLERCTLSLVTSVAIVPTIALVASVLVGVDLAPILLGIVVVTLLAGTLGATRRAGHGAGDRGATGTDDVADATFAAPAELVPTNALTLAAVAVSVLLLVTSAAVAFSGPGQEAGTTELSVGTESGGGFVADGYPGTLDPNGTSTLDVAVEHGSEQAREYEVIATLDAVEYAGASANASDDAGAASGANDTTVTATAELDRYATTVEPDSRSIDTVELDPAAASGAVDAGSESHRVTILLYEGDAPAEPDHEAAHRTVSVPVEVEDE